MLQQVGDPGGVYCLAALLLQDLHGKVHHQGDHLKGTWGGVGLHLFQCLQHLGQFQPHKGAVEHGGEQLELSLGQLSRHPDDLVFHHAGVGHHHHDESALLHHQQIVPLHCHPLWAGRDGEHRVVADLGEDLAGLVDDPVQLLHLQVQRSVDPLRLLKGQLVLPHQLVDIQTVTCGGGDPPGGGVRLFQQPHLGQVCHLIANGGGGHIQSSQLGDGLGAHRLGGVDIGLHDGPQDPLFPVGQFHCTLTSVFF